MPAVIKIFLYLFVFSEGRIVYQHGQQMKRNMEEYGIKTSYRHVHIENKGVIPSHRHYSSGVYNKYVTNYVIITGFSQNSISVYHIEKRLKVKSTQVAPVTWRGHHRMCACVRLWPHPACWCSMSPLALVLF